jgi:hypothetical protein
MEAVLKRDSRGHNQVFIKSHFRTHLPDEPNFFNGEKGVGKRVLLGLDIDKFRYLPRISFLEMRRWVRKGLL